MAAHLDSFPFCSGFSGPPATERLKGVHMLFNAAILSKLLSAGSEAGTSGSENNLAQETRLVAQETRLGAP
jgi:hypothetical protein